jgi:NAD-dependent SIR2 family protein deacetylase
LKPTSTHKLLTQLSEENILKYIITQNCDNLHMKSGTPKDKLSELHGNVFVEYPKQGESEVG